MSTKPHIAIIIGSTRDSRFADKPAQWMLETAQARKDMTFELVDLRDFDLPLFNEQASNLWAPSQDPNVVRWQEKLGSFDGFLFIVAEYNRSITGALKNALDQAYNEWNRKPAAAMGYGSLGGARAVEHLRTIAVELQMVPLRNAVHLGAAQFMKVHPMGDNAAMSEVEDVLKPGATAMLEELSWWAKATKSARAESRTAQAA